MWIVGGHRDGHVQLAELLVAGHDDRLRAAVLAAHARHVQLRRDLGGDDVDPGHERPERDRVVPDERFVLGPVPTRGHSDRQHAGQWHVRLHVHPVREPEGMMVVTTFRERRNANPEAGTAFLLVIVLVAVVGVIAGAALVYAQTSMSASIAYQGQRANVADAENAIRTAIQYAAANPSVYTDLGTTTKNGSTVQQCQSTPVSVGSMNVAVCPNAGSGAASGIPRAAILSLSTSSAEDGIAKGSSGTMRIDGGIFSNTNINAKATISVINGDVYARGACDATVFTVASGHTINCNYGTTTNAIGSDPNFAPLISAPPATATLPSACSGSVKTATLVPGTYTSASALSAITTSCDLTILSPGVYYL